jgi:hypothetical protein
MKEILKCISSLDKCQSSIYLFNHGYDTKVLTETFLQLAAHICDFEILPSSVISINGNPMQ